MVTMIRKTSGVDEAEVDEEEAGIMSDRRRMSRELKTATQNLNNLNQSQSLQSKGW